MNIAMQNLDILQLVNEARKIYPSFLSP
jgi:hypothetical protein